MTDICAFLPAGVDVKQTLGNAPDGARRPVGRPPLKRSVR
jgi:hypothetical protein